MGQGQRERFPGFYAGIFLIAFATLALEVTLTRLLSVVTWYHLAFFAISIALLGMTAGAVTVYLRPRWFEPDRFRDSLFKACLGYAAVVPVSLIILCVSRIGVGVSVWAYGKLLAAALASFLPFYFSGIATAAVLTKCQLPIGKLYACDLAGAALGCLLVLGAIGLVGAPNLVLLCGLIGVLAAGCFAGRLMAGRLRTWSGCILGALVVLLAVGLATPYGIRPMAAKGLPVDRKDVILEKWNSFSMVTVYAETYRRPQYWGASRVAPKEKVYQHKMKIDGGAATDLRRFETTKDIEHLRFDVTNVGYYLRPTGGAFIIGVGGGRDIQTAILFGHERIVGIDINSIFINLLEGRFRQFAGIADHEGVRLVTDEARSFLSRSDDRYSMIQMSLIDTWAATGAGAYALSENALYTVEAWKIILEHLSDDGIFAVSRWYMPGDIGEAGRVVSLAVASLLDRGVDDPSRHMALVTQRSVATLLVSRQPLSSSDVEILRKVCGDLGFSLVLCPGIPSRDQLLGAMVSSRSLGELGLATSGATMNYAPPTDDSPYFFNMLKINQVLPAFVMSGESGNRLSPNELGVAYGNLLATRTLLGLILALVVLAVVAVVLPLAVGLRRRAAPGVRHAILWPAAAYFSLIGAGFMFVEIALVQRLTVFLGHPMYALGILLFTIIASAGLGSYASERLRLTRKPWVFVYPLAISGAVLVIRFLLPVLGRGLVSAPMAIRIPAAVVTILPLGVLLGFGFPVGMSLVRLARAEETPWYWALNGICGVLCSALTVFISIYSGISISLYVGAVCYGLLLACLPAMTKPPVGERTTPTPAQA